jgi:outer membrane receptor for ferrienterochelin and colicin
LRAGIIFQNDHATTRASSSVLEVDDLGQQTQAAPIVIPDSSAQSQQLYSFYVQNEWKAFESLTVNYGLRFDEVNAYVNEGQISPRLNAVWTPAPVRTCRRRDPVEIRRHKRRAQRSHRRFAAV